MRIDPGIKFVICFAVVIMAVSSQLYAENPGHMFLRMENGGRAAGLGNALISIPGELDVMNHNPGGLGTIGENQLSFMHIEWIAGLGYEYLGFAHSFQPFGVIGMNVRYLHDPGFNHLDLEGQVQGTLEYSDLAATIGFGRKLKFLPGLKKQYTGLNVKYIQSTLEDYVLQSFACDIGILGYLGFIDNIGIAVRNIGINFKKAGSSALPLPLNIALGASDMVYDSGMINILLSLETIADSDFNPAINGGIELGIKKLVMLRAGYKGEYEASGLTFGIGLRHRVSNVKVYKKYDVKYMDLGFDYAIALYKELGYCHYISINVKFP